MVISHNYTKLAKAKDIEIPDVYFSRLKTGIEKIDNIFGEGILPGSTFTVDAAPGTGKSTLLLQLCQCYAAVHDVAFLSGEENIFMVALRARRLGCGDVAVAMENRLSDILEVIQGNELVIIDSYPSIVYDLEDADELSAAKQEEKKLLRIIECANNSKCAVGIILHVTKNGTYKGSTTVQHAVDVNISILRDTEDPSIRIIDVTKNRLGSTDAHEFYFGEFGFNFNKLVERAAEDGGSSKSSRGSNRISQMKSILEMKEPPHITIERVCNVLDIDAQRAAYLLWLLVKEGKLEKFGRGDNAVWKFPISQQKEVENA